MPEHHSTEFERIDIADLVREALEPTQGRPARAFTIVQNIVDRFPSEIAIKGFHEFDFDHDLPDDPFSRLFSSEVGKHAMAIIGNEARTLDIIQTLSVDIMLEAARIGASRVDGPGFHLHEDMRRLFVPARNGLPPTLLILDPALDIQDTHRITGDIAVFVPLLVRAPSGDRPRSEEESLRELLLSDALRVQEALRIAQPEVVLSRRPTMELLSVPSPLISVETQAQRSTAGIYCRDQKKTLGVTACYHGTGPIGTGVTVNGLASQVTLANETQDIVFVPLPPGTQPVEMTGISGVLKDRTPSQYGSARFEGATSGPMATSISSHDAGLLRDRPSLQLKVQTPADTNKGDSGSALIDQDGHILGFAFEKSAFGENPQITDWIWAANALRALGLEPV